MIRSIGRTAAAIGVVLFALGVIASVMQLDPEAVHAFRFAFLSLILAGLCWVYERLGARG